MDESGTAGAGVEVVHQTNPPHEDPPPPYIEIEGILTPTPPDTKVATPEPKSIAKARKVINITKHTHKHSQTVLVLQGTKRKQARSAKGKGDAATEGSGEEVTPQKYHEHVTVPSDTNP